MSIDQRLDHIIQLINGLQLEVQSIKQDVNHSISKNQILEKNVLDINQQLTSMENNVSDIKTEIIPLKMDYKVLIDNEEKTQDAFKKFEEIGNVLNKVSVKLDQTMSKQENFNEEINDGKVRLNLLEKNASTYPKEENFSPRPSLSHHPTLNARPTFMFDSSPRKSNEAAYEPEPLFRDPRRTSIYGNQPIFPPSPSFHSQPKRSTNFSNTSTDRYVTTTRQMVHQFSVPQFEKKLENLELSTVIGFFTELSMYMYKHDYRPKLTTCLSLEVIRRLTVQYGQLCTPPVSETNFVCLSDEDVEDMIRRELRARTKDGFIRQLSKKLSCKFHHTPTIHNFPEFINAITTGATEFSYRLSMLYNPENVNICPDFDEKDQGLISIFIGLIRDAIQHDYVRVFWARVPKEVYKRLKHNQELSKPEKFDEFHALLREKLKKDLKSCDIANTFHADFELGASRSAIKTNTPVELDNDAENDVEEDDIEEENVPEENAEDKTPEVHFAPKIILAPGHISRN